MQTTNHGKPGRASTAMADSHILWDVMGNPETSQWFTVAHTDWEAECWVVWHPSGVRIVTNAGGNQPVRDFDEGKGWFGSITRKDGTVVAVEFHGTSTDRMRLFVKMLVPGDGDDTVLPALWPVPLSDLHTVYFW